MRRGGDFDYAQKQEAKAFVVPENLDKPAVQKEFIITNKINYKGGANRQKYGY